jgi:hypothetical protein
MPASISHSSLPPKFADKQRRPGLIHLPQPIIMQSRTANNSNKHQTTPSSGPAKPAAHGANKPHPSYVPSRSQQLRTPSPSPKRRPAAITPSPNPRVSRRTPRQQRAEAPVPPLSPMLTDAESFEFPKRSEKKNKQDTRKQQLISPPPTPAPEPRAKKPKPSFVLPQFTKGSLVSPPPSPLAYKFASNVFGAPTSGLLPAFSLKAPGDSTATSSASDEDDDEDEIILVKQSSSPPAVPSPPPSPGLIREWQAIKALPRPDAATVAWLKQTYDIHPSKPTEPSSEPSTPAIGGTRPMPIVRPSAHLRSPSMPVYPTSRRLTIAQEVRENVAALFGLDSTDINAVNKATAAWRAYAGSTFNDSPEIDEVVAPRVAAPRFLGRMFN